MAVPIRILLVDPDDHTTDVCTQAFENRGWVVRHARTFLEALDLSEKLAFKVVILELQLPDVVGTDAWRYLKALHPNLLGIIITGSPAIRSSIDALDRDILAYLLKPLDLDAVCDSIERRIKRETRTVVTIEIEQPMEGLGKLFSTILLALTPQQVFGDAFANFEAALHPDWIMVYLLSHSELAWTNHFISCFSTQVSEWTPSQSAAVEHHMVRSVQSRQVVVVNGSEPQAPDESSLREVGLGECVIAPLISRDQVFGALGVMNQANSGRIFAPVQIELVTAASKAIALALDNARLTHEVKRQSLDGGPFDK
jgi:ActR/RegA family two-component response regulator